MEDEFEPQSEDTEYNFTEEVKIDEYSLHLENLNQPQLLAKYLAAHADAIRVRDFCKRSSLITRARVEMEVRQEPEKFGVEKVTEAAIKNAVELHVRVVRCEATLLEAEHKVKMLSAAVDSFKERRKAIDGLTTLLQMGYWNIEPRSVDQRSKEIMEEEDRKAHRKALEGKLPRRKADEQS
jgi:hypothetical protein